MANKSMNNISKNLYDEKTNVKKDIDTDKNKMNDEQEIEDEIQTIEPTEELGSIKPIYGELGDGNSKAVEYIDEGVILSLLFLYIFWRLMKSRSFSIFKFFKGNMRTAGTIFLFLSQISNIIYNISVIYLTNYYDFDKSAIEKIGFLTGSHIITLFNFKRQIDVVQILNISFFITNILKISTLFMLIGLWLPCAYSFAIKRRNGDTILENERNNDMTSIFIMNDGIGKQVKKKNDVAEALSHATIITFAKLYAWLRIPLAVVLEINHDFLSEKTIVFYRSVFYGTEIYIAVLFFLILETRFMTIMSGKENIYGGFNNLFRSNSIALEGSEKEVVQNINFLIILLMIEGFVRFYINIIAIPVALSPLTLHILKKVAFVTEFTMVILMVNMLCPMPSQIYDHGENDFASNTNNNKMNDDPWSHQPRLGYSNQENDNSIGRGVIPCINENENTEIVEFADYREGGGIHCGK